MLPTLFASVALVGILNYTAFAADLNAEQMPPKQISDVGTLDEYVRGSPDPNSEPSDVAMLGISVMNGTAKIEGSGQVKGVRICSVLPGTAAAIAGLQSERVGVSSILTAGFFVAGMFFPPAALGAVVVHDAGIGVSYDLILAIDGQRTHTVQELRDALTDAASGEQVYLVLVRAGRRRDVALTLQ